MSDPSKSSSRAEDDFFAFGGDDEDYDLPPPSKKRKKKGHKKHHHHTKKSQENESTSKSGGRLSKMDVSSPSKNISFKSESKEEPKNDDLMKMLGIQDDDSDEDYITGLIINEKSSIKTTRSEPISVKGKRASEDEQLLEQLDSDIMKVEKYETMAEMEEALDRVPTDFLAQTVVVNGEKMNVSDTKFKIDVTVELGDRSLTISLTAKGSTHFKKIQEKICAWLYPKYIEQPVMMPETLVFYIKELDLIVKQFLKIGYLLQLSKKNGKISLPITDDGYHFCTTMSTETKIQATRQLLNLGKQSTSEAASSGNGDPEITINLKDRKTGRSTTIATKRTSVMIDLVSIFLVRLHYPDMLKVTLYGSDGAALPAESSIGDSKIGENETIELDYDQRDFDELQEAAKQHKSDDEYDNDNDIDLRHNLDLTREQDNSYFTINMVGKDKKSYKVQVNPDTEIRLMIDYYRSKAKVEAKVLISLLFDDELLLPSMKVSDTELEEDFIVDVMLQ
ncbi:hypothetical protein FOA43_003048 [Brettanomyces nanus]|uniref:Rad60/SUMO-like domain-containing protein n=1 Tax=Eeniella nana TaxID=13502 RepID=A0A875S7K2_EENNA|nr:uncharacterized protein FOA43_003048 [Brettanomyces nanus]QPG75689.1 hypothetical protein FOA43_003048 [Brettanomyces nanus]